MGLKKSFIDVAKEMGYINDELAEKSIKYQKEENVTPQKALLEIKAITEEIICEVYHQIYGYKILHNIFELNINADFVHKFSIKKLLQLGFIPQYKNKQLCIITSNPQNSLIIEDYIKEIYGHNGVIEYLIVTESNVKHYIHQIFGEASNTNIEVSDIEVIENSNYQNNIHNINLDDISGVVTLVNKIFREAIENGVSDIHFEPQDDCFHIRFRDDGILKSALKAPQNIASQIVNRMKTMANLDVNNNRIIQDGNIRLNTSGKMIDLRVSVLPAVCGENVVVRVLDQTKMDFDIGMLGFSKENEEKFRKLIARPDGIMLITGPTGSGKSTSLYAALSTLNTPERCIITLEDPPEYRMDGIVQVKINPSMNVTFPAGLKSSLRQDLDILLIGEIRDEKTAEIAMSASNSRHMVFSTLHTNSAASSVLRLVKMGVEPFMVASTLSAVINQRLVRRICPNCKEEYYLDDNSPFCKVINNTKNKIRLYRGKGCELCANTGYKGRLAVQEFLIVNDAIREVLYNNGNTLQIESAAINSGMQKIHQDGIDKALAGFTTLEEIHRVIYFDDL